MPSQQDPIKYLRRLHESGQHNDVVQMIRDKRSVLDAFGPVFREPVSLDVDTFAGFLRFETNRHWWNLHRHEPVLVRHFELVREVLVELLGPKGTIGERIDAIGDIPGFTTDLYTAILLVAYPDEFGVRSAISDSAMERLGLMPDFDEDVSVGQQYEAVNEMLAATAQELGVDLWTLDALWWGAEKEHDPAKHFVRRSRAPSAPTKTRSSTKPKKAAPSRPRKPSPETFVCQNCFATKQLRLASDTPGLCVDCA